MGKKPKASDRTVDMFTGSTNLEAQTQADVPVEAKSADPSIEGNADRWLQNAIETQQYLSKRFTECVPETDKFRLTESDGMMSLEKMGLDGNGKAFSWWLVQFNSNSLYELASVVVAAAKARKAQGL